MSFRRFSRSITAPAAAAIIAPLSRKMGNPSPVWTLFSIQRAVRVVSTLTLYTLEAS